MIHLLDRTKILTMVRRTLDLVDPRLMDHGVKVAMVLQDMLKADGCRDRQFSRDLVVLAMLHDIGAYSTEQIDRLVRFETRNVWEHSIYSYLFLREYFRDDRARVVLYHHADCNGPWREESEELMRYAQMLHVADRACIWHDEVKGSKEDLEKHLSAKSGTVFAPEAVALFRRADRLFGTWERLDGAPPLEELGECADLSQREAEDYLNILVDAIDFRSRVTVTHTRSLMEIALEMARLAGMPVETQKRVYYGALLHDLGKIGTPVTILEKPGRLTDEEMAVMRQHVVLSGQIMRDCVEEETAQIALRHHEKLDGSGYPMGLTGAELTQPQRLMAVADIVSALCMSRSYKEAFPKEKCLSILGDMRDRGQLDRDMVDLIEREFDQIIGVTNQRCAPIHDAYARMQREFGELMARYTVQTELVS